MDARVSSAESIVGSADSVYIDKRRWRVLPGQPPAIRARWFRRIGIAALIAFLLLIIILTLTAPLSKSLQPITAPSVTLLSAEGRPIARRGSVVGAPVRVADLPLHVRAAFLACWLEAWLDKDEILSRYLSSVYFGDNVYGLTAAANHYFSKKPEALTVSEAAMLAGLVKAPSTLAPTENFD